MEERLGKEAIPEIETVEDFNSWLQNLEDEEIQRWNTGAWVEMYANLHRLIPLGVWSMLIRDEKYSDLLAKLYRNYRMDKGLFDALKGYAEKVAEEMYINCSDPIVFFKILKGDEREITKFASQLSSIMSKSGDDIEIKTFRAILSSEGFKKGRSVSFNTFMGCDVGTIAHELFHCHNQGFNYLYGTPCDVHILMFYNNLFYMGGSEGEYKAYDKQPLEKTADIFATYFRRAYREKIGIKSEKAIAELDSYLGKVADGIELKFVSVDKGDSYLMNGNWCIWKLPENFDKKIEEVFPDMDENLLNKLQIRKTPNNYISAVIPSDYDTYSQLKKYLNNIYEIEIEHWGMFSSIQNYWNKNVNAKLNGNQEGLLGDKNKIGKRKEFFCELPENFDGDVKDIFPGMDENLFEKLQIRKNEDNCIIISVPFERGIFSQWFKFVERNQQALSKQSEAKQPTEEKDKKVNNMILNRKNENSMG